MEGRGGRQGADARELAMGFTSQNHTSLGLKWLV